MKYDVEIRAVLVKRIPVISSVIIDATNEAIAEGMAIDLANLGDVEWEEYDIDGVITPSEVARYRLDCVEAVVEGWEDEHVED